MKTLGFGIKSLLRDPAWAAKHVGNYQRNNPIKPLENEDDRSAPNKTQTVSGVGNQESIFRSKRGDMDIAAAGFNDSIFAQYKAEAPRRPNDIFSESRVGVAGGNKNIFAMMNKIDEDRKPLMGAQGVQPPHNIDPMNSIPQDENMRKVGRKLNMLM